MSNGQNATRRIGREIAAGSIRAVAFHVVITYIIPIGLPIMTGYLGYLQNFAWMYIMVAAGLMFAAVTTGLVKFDEWRDRRRVDGKLHLVDVRVGRNIRGQGLFLGILLQSAAKVPMGIEVINVSTRIGDRVPIETQFKKTEFVIDPANLFFFDDHIIEITDPPRPGTLEGFAEFNLKYGRIGKLAHDLRIKKQVIVAFNDDGLLVNRSWSDAA